MLLFGRAPIVASLCSSSPQITTDDQLQEGTNSLLLQAQASS